MLAMAESFNRTVPYWTEKTLMAELDVQSLESEDLSRYILNNAFFEYANLKNVNLTLTHLIDANLRYADLFFANLTGANLCGARLNGATLTLANLFFADLRAADLSKAFLYKADFKCVDLAEAIIDRGSLNREILDVKMACFKNTRLFVDGDTLLSVKDSVSIINEIIKARWGYELNEKGVAIDPNNLKTELAIHLE